MKKEIIIYHLLLPLSLLSVSPAKSELLPESYCGNITVKEPFSLTSPTSKNPPLFTPHSLLCKSNALFLSTQIGLFQISAIDYHSKLIGFPKSPRPNSLVLLNCSSRTAAISRRIPGCRQIVNASFKNCSGSGLCRGVGFGHDAACLAIDNDAGERGRGFHPRQLNRRRRSAGRGMGRRILFDLPNGTWHNSNNPLSCEECKSSEGACGPARRSICNMGGNSLGKVNGAVNSILHPNMGTMIWILLIVVLVFCSLAIMKCKKK